ncbi:MAG: hypothetical protein JNK24_02355 [Alphaproteobacteria bacterium]|nr:hypothetical protein [Alphaproteobacteria bacterium]
MAEEDTPEAALAKFKTMMDQAEKDYAISQSSEDPEARIAGAKKYFSQILTIGTLKNIDSEAIDKVQKAFVKLRTDLADMRSKLSEDAAKKQLNVLERMSNQEIDLYTEQAKKAYSVLMSSCSTSIQLLGTAKAFAHIFQAFGIDTTAFVQNCDDLIQLEKRKMPEMPASLVRKANPHIDPTDATGVLQQGGDQALTQLMDDSGNFAAQFFKIMDLAKNGSGASAPPPAPSPNPSSPPHSPLAMDASGVTQIISALRGNSSSVTLPASNLTTQERAQLAQALEDSAIDDQNAGLTARESKIFYDFAQTLFATRPSAVATPGQAANADEYLQKLGLVN